MLFRPIPEPKYFNFSEAMKNILTVAILIAAILPAVANAQETSSWKKNMFTSQDKLFQWGLSAGWVAKEWTTTANGRTYHENLWGDRDKMFHGFQFGLHAQQSVFNGIGWRTGLYYEWYISTSSYVKEQGFSRFNEHGLYLPLHIIFQMSPIKNVCIMPYAGFGFNWAIYGNFKEGPLSGPGGYTGKGYSGNDIVETAILSLVNTAVSSRREYPVEYFDYNNHSPHHWNVQAEVGVALRIYKAELTFTYSWGLNRHWLYDDKPSHQNKMAAQLAFTI